jgi:hypothetical protein
MSTPLTPRRLGEEVPDIVRGDLTVQPGVAPAILRPARSRRLRQLLVLALGLLLVYVTTAYLLAPLAWRGYGHRRHPSLEDIPAVTLTRSGIPGDPVNVAVIGTRPEVLHVLRTAGWHAADPLSFRSSLGIALTSLLRTPYEDAPVSNLYLWGRKEDFAFEQPVGHDPRQRHHVRFWRSDKADPDGRPVWVGSATYDRSVGFSHRSGQITHHIAADVDAERGHLFRDLEQTGEMSEVYEVDGFRKTRSGRNGGGDPWHTDGKLFVAVVASDRLPPPGPGGP